MKTVLQNASVVSVMAPTGGVFERFDLARAKRLFEAACSHCHETSDVDDAPPAIEQEARELVNQMAENRLSETDEDAADQLLLDRDLCKANWVSG